MKNRLIIILGLFVLVAGGILGTQYVLKNQIPKADPEFAKPTTNPDGSPLEGPSGPVRTNF